MIFKSFFFYFVEFLNGLWNLIRLFNTMAFYCAAIFGHIEITEILLRQEGVDINNQNILNQKHSYNSNHFLFFIRFDFI